MKNHSELIKTKLADKQMRENVSSAMHALQDRRKALINAKFQDWQGLRTKAQKAKNNALYTLKDRVLEFEKNATKNGMKVHFANTKEDACEIIYELMMEKKISKVLKGKSMASEEIGLNHYLEHKGLNAIETDLGELILQLGNETPVHIVVPAIHKNRYEIGELFSEKLGVAKESEPEKLNAIARTHLRNEFEGLEMGISGVNFAVSSEGAIWLIENEGNGRMCTTAPTIHVAICGIEKIVESFTDAATTDTLLTPSATGQFIPAYNNIITGPRKADELDGPKEVHVILFNNHRTNILSNEDYYEALRCIRCGACMNFCPVYDKIGGHSYDAVYPGPIGEVISPQLFGMNEHGDILSLCSLCGRCSEVCPVKIPLDSMIRKLRRDKIGEAGDNAPLGANELEHSAMESYGFAKFADIATSPKMWRVAIGNASKFNWLLQSVGTSLPVLKNWATYKDLPELKGNIYKELENLEGVSYE